MTDDSIKTFLRQYVASLKEETRRIKEVNHYGFDHLIEQLGRQEDWILHRAPSHPPATSEDLPQPKKEAEHGVDYAFLTRDQKELIIFVLKDEKLTYHNFDHENFRTDLSRAASPNLTDPVLAGVNTVRVILAYNKDEEEEGLEEYNNHIAKLGTKIGDAVALKFERWNLDHLVDVFHRKIFNPSLLPSNFFRKFTYICLQVEDFSHGSAQWEEVLIPDWQEFLQLVLAEPSKRSVWMVAVAMAIVAKDAKKEPAFETGWIDLVEWAVLALWDAALRSADKHVAGAVLEIWMTVYVGELERFYTAHGPSLGVEDSLSLAMDPSFEPAAESYLAYWHLARLGLLWQSAAVLCPAEGKPEHALFVKEMAKIIDWIIGLQRANAAAWRPTMDSHHIELFLVWAALVGADRQDEIYAWLDNLSKRLALRRRDAGPLRVLSTENTWESVFETIVEGTPQTKSYGRTSYLFLMLEEMCLLFGNPVRDQLLDSIHNHLALGVNSKGESLEYEEDVELASWAPPVGWERLLLEGKLFEQDDSGICITTGNFVRYPNQKEVGLADCLVDFIKQSREKYPLRRETPLPLPVLFLACVKHRCPIPPEFWRAPIFGPMPEKPDNPPPPVAGPNNSPATPAA
ncbi:MAG: hypothetical protein KIT44_00005 [Opitutaceae bacterium]|nr:hypothetical protein [Opitutaceae bacterium]